MLEHLAERWPRHASAHAWLAQLHVLRTQQGLGGKLLGEDTLARTHAAMAVQCDPGSALALAMEGWTLVHVVRDLDDARERYAQAQLAEVDHPVALLLQAELFALQGVGGPARELVARASRSMPLDVLRYLHDHVDALAAFASNDLEAAIAAGRQSLRRNPRYLPAHCVLAAAQAESGDIVEAKRTVQRLLAQQPSFRVAGYVASLPRAAKIIPRIGDALLQGRAPAV
jgi:tetratricopeptide (TPR) repeat protein